MRFWSNEFYLFYQQKRDFHKTVYHANMTNHWLLLMFVRIRVNHRNKNVFVSDSVCSRGTTLAVGLSLAGSCRLIMST